MAAAIGVQQEMLAAQKRLEDETLEACAGGGMVRVTIGGDLTLREVAIAPEAFAAADPELLGEMVQAAVNEATRAAQQLASSLLGGFTADASEAVDARGAPPDEASGRG